jgi:hypothetical protein
MTIESVALTTAGTCPTLELLDSAADAAIIAKSILMHTSRNGNTRGAEGSLRREQAAA